jgi:hypothetical protein
MNAANALRAAVAAGVAIAVDGNDLVLEAVSIPPPDVLNALLRHKPDILALLRPRQDGWSAADWHVFFEERAGIAEFDGALPRSDAEAQAFTCCVVKWLNRNPACSPSGRCLGCGNPAHSHDPLMPYGVESTGYAWLHLRCWEAWQAARKREAVAALTAMGIREPTGTEGLTKGPGGSS